MKSLRRLRIPVSILLLVVLNATSILSQGRQGLGANQAAVAKAGRDQTVSAGSTVTLDGSGSIDADGDSLSYSWSLTSRPAGSLASLENANNVKPSLRVDLPGDYLVQLIVNDGTTNSAPDTVTISMTNSRPVANAGRDQTAEVGSPVTLDGSGSSDADGNQLQFAWVFVSQPAGSNAVFSNATDVVSTFVPDVPGKYVVGLLVHDGLIVSSPDTITISTVNSAPVADPGRDQTVSTGSPVSLNGSGSTDADGDSLKYAWSFLSRPARSVARLSDPEAVLPTFVADRPGTYVVQLAVHDGTAASTPKTIIVVTHNSVPVANAGAGQSVATGALVLLNGSASSDADGDTLTFRWALTTQPNGSKASISAPQTPQPFFVVDKPGVYVAQLIVSDGLTNSAPATVTIRTTNSPPQGNAGPDKLNAATGDDVPLSGIQSSDPDGDPLTYAWSFITRPAESEAVLDDPGAVAPIFTPDEPGDYVVQLVVNDGLLSSKPDTVLVHVSQGVPVARVSATDPTAKEGERDSGTFTFKRTGPATSPLVVHYSVGGSATNGVDYTPSLSGTVTIPAGQKSTIVTIAPVSDGILEGDETVVVTLLSDPAYKIVPQGKGVPRSNGLTYTGTVTIIDNNDLRVVTVSATDASASETGSNPGTFTFTRTGLTTSLTVLYSISGTATNGTDYTPTLTGSITIPSGQASATATITPVDDAIVEGDETAIVTLTANAAYSLGSPSSATVTIADNDVASVSVTATDPSASETAANSGTFTFTRTGPTTSSLVVQYSIGGTAAAGDYTPALSGTVTIASGQASATVTITPVDDSLVEGDETVVLTITANAAYSVGSPASATVTIADNDAPTVTVTATDANASEAGPDAGTFTFTRNGPTTSSLAVQYSIGGTAVAGDYTPALSGTVTIASGQASATVTITPVDDSLVEGDETVVLTITANAAYSVGSPASATVTIADNDAPTVTVTATDANASEAGPDAGTFTFTRNGATTSALTVLYSIGGTAAAGDYTPALSGTVTIPAGQASAAVTITPVDDSIVEGDETVVLTITANAAYSVGSPAAATVTIADNDVASVTVTATDANASETGPDAGTFTFTRTGPTTSALAVLYSIGGTASAGDYTPALSGTVTIPSGQASAAITITPVDDSIVEGSETVVLTITANAAYSIGNPGTATVTIADNDAPTVTLSATDSRASELGPDTGTFTFTRNGPTTGDLVVQYTIGGTATAADYTPTLTGSITIPSGQASATLTITPVNDTIFEGDETLTLTVTPNAAYSVGSPSSDTVLIGDDDLPTITVTATDAAASETGSDPGTFTFARTGPATFAFPVTVQYTVGGTATGSDYTPTLTGSVTIAAGQTTATVTITPVDDALVEGDETVTATITASGAYVVGSPVTATITIADNDVALPTVTVSATDAAASEAGPDPATFTFTRTGPTTSALTILYLVGGTASNGTDYTPTLSGSINIPIGQSTALLTITPVDDPNAEANEQVTVSLFTNAAYSVGSPSTAVATIVDNDVPTVTVAAPDTAASETGPDTGTFAFTRTGPTTSTLTVAYQVGGTATNGTDYTPTLSGSVTIAVGQSTALVLITPVDDTDVEGSEQVTVSLSNDAAYTVGSPNTALVTIADNDLPGVTVFATDATASETGPDAGTFTFARTGPTTSSLTVLYSVGGTATNGSDFSPTLNGSVTIPSGQASVDVTITPGPDNLVESGETVIVTLTANAAYSIGAPNSATVTIADNPAAVSLTVLDGDASEPGADTGAFIFTRTGGNPTAALTVNYAIGGTAVNGTDYVLIPGSINIPANDSSASLTIAPLADGIIESTETVVLTVTSTASYNAGSPATGTVNIADSPAVVEVGATDPNAFETGLDPGVFTFIRSGGNISAPLQVFFSVSGTATLGTDYSNIGTSVTIPANEVSTSVTITPLTDALVEGDETVVVTITSNASYNIGASNAGTGTIHDASSTPLVSVTAIDSSASEVGPDPGAFRFTRTGSTTSPMTVNFSVVGTAINGTDYVTIATSIVIQSGQTSADLAITPVPDALSEGAETVIVTVTDAAAYDVGTPAAATVTIGDTGGSGCGPEGGPLTNGATHCGTISNAGETDTWTFTANAGDRIAVHIGEVIDNNGFVPWIRVISPTSTSLGSASGVVAAALNDIVAPTTGTYQVLVASFDSGFNGSGTYLLTMSHTPGPITISAGDQGGPLTNGAMHTGEIFPGDLDTWTFTANAGERIAVHIGEITDNVGAFTPWIRVWAPNGASLGSASGVGGAALNDMVAPVTGTYLVLAASFDSGFDGSGTYRLTMTHTPGPITVSTGDEGGPLDNGAMHTGEILKGDLDTWTFTANAGERIAVHIGEITDTVGDFTPWIRVWAPNGASLGSASGVGGAALNDMVAPVTGTYLVLAASFDSGFDGSGTYRLTMTHTPGPITVSTGDQGGPLDNGALHTGEILKGDLDVWTFTANQGDRIAVHIGEITDTSTDFTPWIRVWAPNSASLGSASGVGGAALNDMVAPVTGTYLVLAASFDSGFDGSGTYELTMTHTPGPITVSSGDQGGPLDNGALQTGEVLKGDLDVWTFTATTGDRIAVHIGEITDAVGDFTPWIRVWAPNGASLGSASGVGGAALNDMVAPVTGTYLVLVASFDSGFDGSGTYELTMTHTPGPITVSGGDQGGPLDNGALQTGEILKGDLDVWTFTANQGDRIAVHIGEITDTNGSFTPWIRVWAPNGASLGSASGIGAAALTDMVAPVTGTYLVLVASFDSGFDGTGTYRLTMTHTPGPITVSAGDQGGPATLGAANSGEILAGDLDVWTVSAIAGEHISIQINETSETNDFHPWIRLWTPAGGSLGSVSGVTSAALTNVVAPTTGTYLILVGSFDSGFDGTGTYSLVVTKP